MSVSGEGPSGRRYSMRQLDDLLETELPAYRAAVAAREGRPPRHRAALHVLTFVVCAVIGVILTVGAHQLTVGRGAAGDHHARLVDSVKQGQAEVAAQETEVNRLQGEVAALRHEGTGAADQRLDQAIVTAAARADYSPVQGRGVSLVLDDRNAVDTGADTSRAGKGLPPEKVGYDDLQVIVNALWRSGADAVAVNGIRMTSLSTIRFAGQAVIVDFTPLAPPYTVSAIGEQSSLEHALTSGTVSSLRQTLESYGVVITDERRDHLELEAGRSDQLRSAAPVETGDAAADEGRAP